MSQKTAILWSSRCTIIYIMSHAYTSNIGSYNFIFKKMQKNSFWLKIRIVEYWLYAEIIIAYCTLFVCSRWIFNSNVDNQLFHPFATELYLILTSIDTETHINTSAAVCLKCICYFFYFTISILRIKIS